MYIFYLKSNCNSGSPFEQLQGGGPLIIFYFHPYLGKIPILTHIFSIGWFNHHLVIINCSDSEKTSWCGGGPRIVDAETPIDHSQVTSFLGFVSWVNESSDWCLICMPRTQLTSIFEGQPSKTRPFSIKTGVIWLLGVCVYIYIYMYIMYIPHFWMLFPSGNNGKWRLKKGNPLLINVIVLVLGCILWKATSIPNVPWSEVAFFLGMGDLPPLMTGILIMGPYKPLRTWVDDHPLLYGNNGSLDPGTNVY